jgi:hypothetical protein
MLRLAPWLADHGKVKADAPAAAPVAITPVVKKAAVAPAPDAAIPLTFTLKLKNGTVETGSFARVLEACCKGELLSLIRCAPHQLAAVTEVWAITIKAAGIYHRNLDKWSVQQWEKALAEIPLDIVPAPGKAGFLQPFIDGAVYKNTTFENIDSVPSGPEHFIKGTEVFDDPELAAFALMGGLRSGYGGSGHPGAARSRILTTMVSDDCSLSSEVMELAKALPERPGSCLADHFLWTEWRHDHSERLPLPFIDCREARIIKMEDGLQAQWTSSSKPRVQTNWLHDPHTPQERSGKPYRLTKKRYWSHKVIHAALFGSKKVKRPGILNRDDPFLVRLAGTQHEKATTGVSSFHEVIYTIPADIFGDDKLCASLSEAALEVVAKAETAITIAGMVTYGEQFNKWGNTPLSNALQKRLTAILGPRSVTEVLRLLKLKGEGSQEALHAMARIGLREAWASVLETAHVLSAAKGFVVLERLMRKKLPLPEDTMKKDGPKIDDKGKVKAEPDVKGKGKKAVKDEKTEKATPDKDEKPRDRTKVEIEFDELKDGVRKNIGRILAHLTPDHRASIRSTTVGLPSGTLLALARIQPSDDATHPYRGRVWVTAIKSIAQVERYGGRNMGSELGETGYPETRIEKLLNSTGDIFLSEFNEAVRWLVSKGADAINPIDLICLGLAGNHKLRETIRLRIALNYARAVAYQ